MLTAGQIRAARAMLGWTAATLALRAGIGQDNIRHMENRLDWPRGRPEALVAQVRQAFEAAGVTFLDEEGGSGPGLRCGKATNPSG